MPLFRTCLTAVGVLCLPWTLLATAEAACVPVTTPAELDHIRAHKARDYCLQNDLDMSGFGPFVPIGNAARPFTGTFDGQGHVIRNLTVNATRKEIGLFGRIADGAVSNLTLAGVSVTSSQNTWWAGGVAGFLSGSAQVSNVHVTGRIECTSRQCRLGGIVGETDAGTTISDSSSDAFVGGGSGGASGGAAGQVAGIIERTYATGRVDCRDNCAAGGLVGWIKDDTGTATDTFATGPVTGRNDGWAGGFAAYQGGTVLRSYSTGRTKVKHGDAAAFVGNFSGPTTEAFATGRVSGRSDGQLGGFAALLGENQLANSSYWDRQITRQTFTVRGTAQTLAELQADLPAGFGAGWAIAKGFSYPYLNLLDSGMFASTLATARVKRLLYTFVPLAQREPTEYAVTPAFADQASLAAAYTMVARAIGLTEAVSALEATKIDDDFWNDGTQTTTWAGPITTRASIANFVAIGGGSPIDDSNIVGELKAGRIAVIRGSYTPDGGGSAFHWMLATLFTSDGSGNVTALVANDPWTGTQIRIDPTTKQVIFPADFPLAGFTVDGYRVITLNGL